MKKLQIGNMSSRELADWFGISYGYFRRKISQKLKVLSDYCTFERTTTGVKITSIFYDTYEGELSKQDIQTTVKYVKKQQKIQNTDRPWLTGAMMAQDLAEEGHPGYCNLTIESGKNKACRALKQTYGTAGYYCADKADPTPGPYGKRYWVWATKDYAENQYLPLTEEDWEVFDKVFHLTNDAKDKERQRMETMIKQDYIEGKLTSNQFAEQIVKVQNVDFKHALKSFKDITGKVLVHCQEYELNTPGAF